MKISHHWLSDYINLDGLSVEEVSNHLTLLGLEVDQVEHKGSSLDGVVLGYVKEVKQHPNADRLKVCQVNIGDEEVQIVCGAQNVAADQYVPVATIGTVLPITLDDGKPLKIKKGKLRGEVSMGMICAEDELGLGQNHDGIMVFDQIDVKYPIGSPIDSLVSVWKDDIYEIELTPNRPDATCHFGVARDLSAKLNRPLNEIELSATINAIPIQSTPSENTPSISIKQPELCHRYVGIEIEGVKIGPSPEWLRNRLESVGLRSLNNVVDATNYVMFTLGQPLHAFDFEKIDGKEIIVSNYDQKLIFTTLDNEERTIPAGSLMINDATKAVAVAGIMGGLHSEVDDSTTNILVESAYFDPVSVRKTSKSLALQTDSSYRFERGIDPNGCLRAAQYCTDLILKLAGGSVKGDILDLYPSKIGAQSIKIRPSFANKILGIDLPTSKMIQIFEGLGFGVQEIDNDLFISVPTFRPDISREIDLVEELIRVYDLNEIPKPTHGHLITPAPLPKRFVFKEKIKKLAVELGFQEIYTNSLLAEIDAPSENDMRLRTLNPISSEMSVLRDQLEWGMLQSIARNYNHLASGMKFFEIGNIFKKVEPQNGSYHSGILEQTIIQLGLTGQTNKVDWKNAASEQDFFELKAAVYSLLSGLGLQENIQEELSEENLLLIKSNVILASIRKADAKAVKSLKIKKPIYVAELNLDALIDSGELKRTYKPISKFPPFELDLAFIVEKQLSVGDLVRSIRTVTKTMLADIRIFDIYEGEQVAEGKKSIAFRLLLQAEQTLTSKQIDPIIKKIAKKLLHEHNAELRDS